MSRITTRAMLLLTIGTLWCTSFVDAAVGQFDMTDAIYSWNLDVKDAGDMKNLTETSVDGDVYSQAYELAQYNLTKGALDAIDQTHQSIAQRCDGDLPLHHVSNVFAETTAGQEYFNMMDNRDMVDGIDRGNFSTGCLEVVKCYFADEGIDGIGELTYSSSTIQTCKSVVSETFRTMSLRSSALLEMKQSNYGDEFYSNGDPDDAAYDLLVDIEKIGDTLFRHNDDPSRVHLYDMNSSDFPGDSNPLDLTPYDTNLPNWDQDDPTNRLPPSNGRRPIDITPDEDGGAPQPADGPARGIGMLGDAEGPSSPTQSDGGGTIQNNFCVALDLEEDTQPDMLELGIAEQKETYTDNENLDLPGRLAVALLGRIAPELEEQFGLDGVPDPEVTTRGSVEDILEGLDFSSEEVDTMIDNFKECILGHTEDGNVNLLQKRIRTTLTQPTALSSCAQQAMCKQIGDDSGRGLYRFELCKIPARRYEVNAQEPVTSIEEIVDAVGNVCTSLKESGELIEHNKTKDQWEHKLMRVNLGEKVSFGMSVSFVPLQDDVDPAAVKRQQVERTKHLEDLLLDISDEIDPQERNKYVLMYNPVAEQASDDIDPAEVAQQRAATYQEESAGGSAEEKYDGSQLTHYPILLDEIDEFIRQNNSFWLVTNDYMHSLNQKWQATFEQFKNDPGK